MDNTKLPAYPQLTSTNKNVQLQGPDYRHQNSGGFTKLELASLMMAESWIKVYGSQLKDEQIAQYAVSTAKAVLEEANK